MSLLTALLRHQLRHHHEDGLLDSLESPAAYRRWAPGIRGLLRLRYLEEKRRVLDKQRDTLTVPQNIATVHNAIREQLGPAESRFVPGVWFCRPIVFYIGLLMLVLLLLGSVVYQWHHTAERQLFSDIIPRYSDSVYRWKAEVERDAASEQLPQLVADMDTLRGEILNFYAGVPALREPLKALLDTLRSEYIHPRELPPLAKAVNDILHRQGIAYYISAVSEAAPCSFLPHERFLERLFGGAQASEERCVVHALLTFTVDESRFYHEQSNQHLTLFTRRFDQLKIDEQVLGRVHIGDNTAQVLLGNIAGVSNHSLAAINNGTLQAKLMPQGMTDVYGLESLARRLQARVINGYVEEIEQHWLQRLRALWFELRGQRSNSLALAARRLEGRLADVTAFHEVQHLVDQALPITEPEWFDTAVRAFGKRIRNDDFRKHVLWELSAFFTHLAYADELQGVILNDFTAITLNPMLQDQPHFYAVRLLLPILHQMATEGRVSPPVPALTLAEVARAYKTLAGNPDDIGRLAREAYPVLFQQELPVLRPMSQRQNHLRDISRQLRLAIYKFLNAGSTAGDAPPA